MNLRRFLLLLACALLAQGCGDRRQHVGKEIQKIGAERLRREAALLYKDWFARHGRPDLTEIWYKDWPPSFQKLKPLHVGAYIDGFSIALETGHHGESGLFVVPETMDHRPTEVRGVTYERLVEGIFWYSFGDGER